MKIRNGFVSNSSSSSFVVAKVFLTKEQIEEVRNFFREHNDSEDEYYVHESEHYFTGSGENYYDSKFDDLFDKMDLGNKVYWGDH